MFTRGASLGRRRLPASSRCIRVVTIRLLLIRLIKTEGVTFTHGVPTLLKMLLDAAAKADVDLVGLKMVIGGSELPKALAKQAMDRGVDVFAGYGMSETGPLLSAAQGRQQSSRRVEVCRCSHSFG
jgi:acyl-CoA synthetase (AMP-forming)/AMP-acid ligase II